MKIFFGLLLIANIAFGLVQWLLPYEQIRVQADTKKIPVAEKLKLLNEAINTAPMSESEAVSIEPADSGQKLETLVVEDNSESQLCFTTGPFKDKTKALEVSGRYSASNIKPSLKSSLEKEYLGIMVYISGHKDRDAAIERAEKLAAHGIRENIIVNEPGKSNILSMGVFGLKVNAERLTDRLKQLNYPVQTEARYRVRTIYWLYHQQSNKRDLRTLLTEQDRSSGISQIPRQCS
jgi:hypothetical protein